MSNFQTSTPPTLQLSKPTYRRGHHRQLEVMASLALQQIAWWKKKGGTILTSRDVHINRQSSLNSQSSLIRQLKLTGNSESRTAQAQARQVKRTRLYPIIRVLGSTQYCHGVHLNLLTLQSACVGTT